MPVICIPIQCDQPLVAHRLAELQLGICFNYKTLTSEKLRRAIHHIFEDNTYLERLVKFSALSRKCNGPIKSADLIIDLMQNLDKKTL